MGIEYAAATSVVSGMLHYRVIGPKLRVEREKDGSTESILLADVVSVRLFMSRGLGRCVIETRDGRKVELANQHVRGFGDFVDQSAEYRAFLEQVHVELAKAAPSASYVAGSNALFVLGIIVMLLTVAFVVVFTTAVVMKGRVRFGSLAPLGTSSIGVAIAWYAVRQGRAKPYDPLDLPWAFVP